jgi:prophage antirepressor-like protein
MSDFIVDIFNNILKINDRDVFIIIDLDGAIWFGFKSLLKAFNYKSKSKDYKLININSKFLKSYKKIKVPPSMGVPLNFQPKTKFINESGLYQLLSKSTKPLAKKFMEKYFIDIMPEIRKSGKYILSHKEKKRINKLNKKILNLRQENYYLDNSKKYIKSNNGYLYISTGHSPINGVTKKVYKLGYSKDIKKRIKSYKTGNPNFKLKYYITTQLNKEQIEKCVLNVNKQHLIKKNNEIIYIKLRDLIQDLHDCQNLISSKICKCIKCKKKIKLHKLNYHKCKKLTKLKLIKEKI